MDCNKLYFAEVIRNVLMTGKYGYNASIPFSMVCNLRFTILHYTFKVLNRTHVGHKLPVEMSLQ